jgi:hypothetical protein
MTVTTWIWLSNSLNRGGIEMGQGRILLSAQICAERRDYSTDQ